MLVAPGYIIASYTLFWFIPIGYCEKVLLQMLKLKYNKVDWQETKLKKKEKSGVAWIDSSLLIESNPTLFYSATPTIFSHSYNFNNFSLSSTLRNLKMVAGSWNLCKTELLRVILSDGKRQ